jgi:hypothetical protein
LVSKHFGQRGSKIIKIAPLPSPSYGSFLVKAKDGFWYRAVNDLGGIRILERIEFY